LNSNRLVLGSLAALAGLVIFFVVAAPQLHHYDDFSYLYGASHYSVHALANGEFQGSNVPGFYNAKIGHLALLKGLTNVFGDGLSGIRAIEFTYTLMLIGAALALAGVVRSLHGASRLQALMIGSLSMCVPVTVYFAGKLLAEGPTLMWGALSLLFLAWSLRTESNGRRIGLWIVSAVFFVMALYTRIQFVVYPGGMWLALLAVPPEGITRKQVLQTTVTVGVISLVLLGLSELLLDWKLIRGFLTAAVVADQDTYWKAKVYKVLFAFGPFLLAVPPALLLVRDRTVRFYLTWFVISSVPIIVMFSYFETRWLLTAAPPLAALTFYVLAHAWRFLEKSSRLELAGKAVVVALTAVVIVASNRHIQSRTEFGLDEIELNKAKAWVDQTYPGNVLLIPWAHSDYAYLSYAYPEGAIYTVSSGHFFTPYTYIKEAKLWPAEMQRWYGPKFIANTDGLRQFDKRPMLAIAWNRSGGAWDGLKTSWIADEPTLKRSLVHRQGPYQVYLFEPASPQ